MSNIQYSSKRQFKRNKLKILKLNKAYLENDHEFIFKGKVYLIVFLINFVEGFF